MKCSKTGCTKKTKLTHYCSQLVCQKCLAKAQAEKAIENEIYIGIQKDKAVARVADYYLANLSLIKALPFKNKKECLRLIDDYFKNHALHETEFCILIQDLINLNKGNATTQYPYPNDNRLNPQKADVVDRLNLIAIEGKAAYWGSQAQRQLPHQIVEYNDAFKKKGKSKKYPNGKKWLIIAMSPDGYQPQTMDFVTGMSIILRVVHS